MAEVVKPVINQFALVTNYWLENPRLKDSIVLFSNGYRKSCVESTLRLLQMDISVKTIYMSLANLMFTSKGFLSQTRKAL